MGYHFKCFLYCLKTADLFVLSTYWVFSRYDQYKLNHLTTLLTQTLLQIQLIVIQAYFHSGNVLKLQQEFDPGAF